MLVITISKRMAAIAASIVAVVAVGASVLLISDDGPRRPAESATAQGAETQTCAPTSSPTETAASAPSSGTRAGGASRSGGGTAAEQSVHYPTVESAVAATDRAQRWRYDATSTVSDATTSGSGSVDLSTDSVDVVAQTGSATTEFRRIGETLYIDARRLGAGGTTWVALDASDQSTQLSGRAARSLVSSLSPNYVLAALHYPLSIDRAADDEFGSHFRVEVVGPSSSLFPLFDIFGTPIDPSSTVVDVWIDAQGHIARIGFAADHASTIFSLRDFGQGVDIPSPPASDVSGPNSASGTYLFGPSIALSTRSVATHSITVDPSVELNDGIVRGALHATSATGDEMRYEFLGSDSGGKLDLGTVTDGPLAGPQSFTALPYANWLDGLAKGTQAFDVRVREATEVGRRLTSMPFIGPIALPVIDLLQDDPTVAARLASIIGVATTAKVNVDVGALAPSNTPLAFTRKIESFDGTRISTNFFPASGLPIGGTAPLALMGNALGVAGSTNPYLGRIDGVVPGPETMRTARGVGDVAFDVITWDPRGTFDSEGVLQLDNPFYEGRDVSAIIDFAATSAPVTLDGTNDPAVGMIGASYGGAIQLVVAGTDPRMDAIVPVESFNSLAADLQPADLVHSSAVSTLLAALNSPNVRSSEQIRRGLSDALRTGQLSGSTRALLAPNTMTPLLQQLQSPTLLMQSTNDPFLPLTESVANAQSILANPYGVPTKLAWFNGPVPDEGAAATLVSYTKSWLKKYVAGVPIPDAFTPNFQWWDRAGNRYTSALYPFSPGFSSVTPLQATSPGGTLTIAPAGGAVTTIPLSFAVPANGRIVGMPVISFTYSGTGDAATVFARIIDPASGLPLSPRASSIPVVLDGQQHTVSVSMDNQIFTAGGGGATLAIELMSAATGFPTPTSGQVSISTVVVDVPQVS